MSQKRLKVGWFSFSCCEDSTIIFTELLNTHYHSWKQLIDFRSILVMQRREQLEDLDVAFIEGAITSQSQEDKAKLLRSKAKCVVAIGSCACTGLPSGQRNQFDETKKKEIEFLLLRFQYAPMVKKLSDVISVDDSVAGCPMDEKRFLQIIEKYLKQFEVIS